MKRGKLILDFDGTLTDISRHEEPYSQGFIEEFRNNITQSKRTIEAMVNHYRPLVLNTPDMGWIVDGHNVVRGSADPYVIYAAIFQEICKDVGLHEEYVKDVLFACYDAGYKKCPTEFRPEAKAILEAAAEVFDVYIITNSSTAGVQSKLATLGINITTDMNDSNGAVRLHGNAKKYLITPEWTGLPETITPPGFPREVLTRRKSYSDVLDSISRDPEEVTVVGDVFEMDGIVPLLKDIRFIQIENGFTAQYARYEKAFMQSGDKKSFAQDLKEVAAYLGLKI